MFDKTHGSSPIDTAKKCFAENLRIYGQTDPEKYNLYNGLANLAIAVERIQMQMGDVQVSIRNRD